jgi:uncharacterized protein YbjT (DUF2867 family)
MPSSVLVTGGTSRLGRRVVRRLRDAGRDVRVLTRRSPEATDGVRHLTGDLRSGEGVDAAVDGVAAIVHCATSGKGDVATTRTLVRAASRAGSPHLVYVSIVGVDHLPAWGYSKAKLQAERVVADSGLPWTILRATQFYDYLLAGLRRMARLPVVRCRPASCPTDRPRRRGGQAGRADAGRARRPGAHNGRPPGDQLGRHAPRIPGRQPPPPLAGAHPDPGNPRRPRRRSPATTSPRHRPPDMGAVPGRDTAATGRFAGHAVGSDRSG